MENKFPIATNDRALFTGATGSGKSYLATRLLRPVKRAVIIDPKGEMDAEKLKAVPPSGQAKKQLMSGESVRILYQPDRNQDSDETWEEALALAYDAQDCLVYIDELYLVVPPGSKPPQILTAIATTGRSQGVGMWAATQRPVWIPLFALSEATHYFVFSLVMPEDRKRMASFMGEEVISPIDDEHGFYYYNVRSRKLVYLKKLEA